MLGLEAGSKHGCIGIMLTQMNAGKHLPDTAFGCLGVHFPTGPIALHFVSLLLAHDDCLHTLTCQREFCKICMCR